jgi:hypothetical protein
MNLLFLVGTVPDGDGFAGSLILRDKSAKWHCSHRHAARADADLCAWVTGDIDDVWQEAPQGWDRHWIRAGEAWVKVP